MSKKKQKVQTIPLKSWYDIYKERMNEQYEAHIKAKYGPFINVIHDIFKEQAVEYVELGCGAGNITKVLRELSPSSFFSLVDKCPKMLGLSIENNPTPNCLFTCSDITTNHLSTFDPNRTVVHSHGVLEHFSDEKIIDIIRLADNTSTFQVHYVPLSKYEKPSRGDERLLTSDQWVDIISKVDRPLDYQLMEFNSGYDLIIKLFRRS